MVIYHGPDETEQLWPKKTCGYKGL